MAVIETGNHFWDKVSLSMTVAPNGTVDAAPTVTVDPPELGANLVVSGDGLTAVLTVDNDVAAFAVTFQAPADNPTTPELESVSATFAGSFTHSKATELAGSFVEVPRV